MSAVAAVFAAWLAARPPSPDGFYEFNPTGEVRPGALLRVEPFRTGVPDTAEAHRILYGTTRADGSATVASAIVLSGRSHAPGLRPVVAWTHGTTGIARGCAPSLSTKPFANLPALAGIVERGWSLVAPDYVGLGTSGPHAYLVGDESARATLDAVRAATEMSGSQIGRRIVLWGHSQGGHSAMWAAIRAPSYAGDIDVAGVVAMAPATDLPALVARARTTPFGKIVSSYLAHGYASVYRDVPLDSYVRRNTRFLVDDIASRCVGGWETLVSFAQALLLPKDGVFVQDPGGGSFGARLRENAPTRPIAAPLLIAQGESDDLVLPDVQKAFVASRCAAGQPVEYRAFSGRDHISLVSDDSPLAAFAIGWTADRFDRRPPPPNCPSSGQ